MSELQWAPLSSLADVTMGQSPGADHLNTDGNGLPFLQGCAEFGERHPEPKIFCDPPLRTAKGSSVLISVRAPVGTMNYADQDYCIGRGLGAFKAKEGLSNSIFLKHAVEHSVGYLHRRSQGSTFAAVSTTDINTVPVPMFEFAEQNKIADIAQTIDLALEKTEALIEKYQQIKAGLMHDLFTRGIGADGKLRSPREQAPELYQHTPIGWIPKEWQIKPCSDLCSRICVGIVIQPTQYYVEDGVPAFRSANVREDGVDPSNFVYISASSNLLLGKSQLKAGDIITVRTGYPGTSAVVPKEFHGANCIDILISTPNEKITADFLCDWINSSFGKGQVLRQQGGMAQQHFNVGEMKELLVALPKMKEQLDFRAKASVIADKLKIERALLDKLKKQKNGLMHDLLTGKVHVKPETTALEVTGG
jgi:type I restriction enzyme S subunit